MTLDYQTMRTFADSWGLLYLVLVFIVVVLWAFRPGSKSANTDAANIPFKEDK